MAAHSLRITARFALVLAVVVPALLVVVFAGLHGAQSGRNAVNSLYSDHLLTTQNITALDIALEDAHQSSLETLLDDSPAERKRLVGQLTSQVSPVVEANLSRLIARASDDPAERALVQTIVDGWASFQQLLVDGDLVAGAAAGRAAVSDRTSALFDSTTAAAKNLITIEGRQSARAHAHALSSYRHSVDLMLIAAAVGLASAVGVVAWLIRSVLPRTLAYSAFAGEVSRGHYQRRMRPAGDDELAQLGRVLDDLAQRRQDEDAYDHNQRELLESLQLTESEQEARGLLKSHLQRSVGNSEITVLNRNNSADRLQAATPVDPSAPLAARLDSAQPRSCLAIRKAQPHNANGADATLLACQVCSGCPGFTTCTPLIVGGEVIGSVLANHEEPLSKVEQRSIRETVTQAAPVIGNLRNLAIAELRAATDALTGLPNKRSVHDSIRRMVAHSARTFTPLAALMCDIDHFKHVNDRYGHSRGDDVLAAVGAVLTDTVRASDFAGRYGGEEFLMLLPDTDTDGAFILAENLRSRISAIRISGIDDPITMSIGVATVPDHAVDADSLLRAADRALYAAKTAGRNRTIRFTTQPTVLAEAPPAISA